MVDNQELAFKWARLGFIGIAFIPVFIYHFYLEFLKIKKTRLIFLLYLLTIFFAMISQTDLIYKRLDKYFWGWYPIAGKFYPFCFLLFVGTFAHSIKILYFSLLELKAKSSARYNQLKYLLCAFFIACFGVVDYITKFGVIIIYPCGYLAALGWILIVAYAIIRYRLMDISVTITRTGIFLTIYTLVLGLPFLLANFGREWLIGLFRANWWTAPLILMAVLATVGPFIFIYLKNKADARLLKEQRKYQETLKQAAIGMTRIRDLNKLLNLIVHILTKTVRISHSAVYLYDAKTDFFMLEAGRNLKHSKIETVITSVNKKSTLMIWIQNHPEPMIYEEARRKAESNPHNLIFNEIEEQLRSLNASILVPSFLEDRFVGFLIMGDKLSGQVYTNEDLEIFSVLASQAALAIENAQFILEAKVMQEQIAQAEKMATIGTMADGLSHQINNRLHALMMIAGDTLDTLKLTDTTNFSDKTKELTRQINYSLERIHANVVQGKEVVEGLLKYSRKGDSGFGPVGLNEILDGTLEMLKFKIKVSEIDIMRNYPHDLPKIKGNLTQLQEVFFNFIDNAYDAIVERRNLLKEEGYRGKILIQAFPQNGKLEIILEDNGIGVKKEDKHKVFTPFFTTKVSSRRGTGLGLFVIQRIISEFHNGIIHFDSNYGKGTRFMLELPTTQE